MKTTLFLIGLLALIGFTFLSGCTNQPQTEQEHIVTTLDTPFQLHIDQSAFIEREDLRITFLDVTEDSRCPSTVTCIWAGEVTVVVSIFKNDQSLGTINLTIEPFDDLAVKNVGDYSVKLLKVEPYPEDLTEIDLSDYRATFVVSKV